MKKNAPPTRRAQLAAQLGMFTYVELRDLAREFRDMTVARADPKEDLGGFDIANPTDWAELLADWGEAVRDGC